MAAVIGSVGGGGEGREQNGTVRQLCSYIERISWLRVRQDGQVRGSVRLVQHSAVVPGVGECNRSPLGNVSLLLAAVSPSRRSDSGSSYMTSAAATASAADLTQFSAARAGLCLLPCSA